jgi:hypothetical protein
MLLVMFAILLFTKKSDPIYLSMCFFLLSAFTAAEVERGDSWPAWVYALLSFLVLPVASFWFWPLGEASAVQLHSMSMAGDRNALIMVAGQTLLLFCYVFFMLKVLWELHISGREINPALDIKPVRVADTAVPQA